MWWGPARTFPGKAERQGGQQGLLVGHRVEGVTCRECLQRRGGPRAGGHSAQAVWPLAGLGSQSGPTEAHEQISLCDQNPRGTHASVLQCPGDKRLLGRGVDREEAQLPQLQGQGPQGPSSCLGLPGALTRLGLLRHPLRWNVMSLSLGPRPPGSSGSPVRHATWPASFPSPASPRSEASAAETPGWGQRLEQGTPDGPLGAAAHPSSASPDSRPAASA